MEYHGNSLKNCQEGAVSIRDYLRIVKQPVRNIEMAYTTRLGGVSSSPYDSFNLGLHVGDDPADVHENRCKLLESLPGAEKIIWLNQIHSSIVFDADSAGEQATVPDADATVTTRRNIVLAIMTADCLPVLLTSLDGRVVGAAHCGWRGLAAGVLRNTVNRMSVNPAEILAWLGPCIGNRVFEVGEDVRQAFITVNSENDDCFVRCVPDTVICEKQYDPEKNCSVLLSPDGISDVSARYIADLPKLAEKELKRMGVNSVLFSGECTYSSPEYFYSYRRDRNTGRMASLIRIL